MRVLLDIVKDEVAEIGSLPFKSKFGLGRCGANLSRVIGMLMLQWKTAIR